VARPVEKILKIERPKTIPEMKLDTIEAFPSALELDLTNIEPYVEPKMNVNIDLGLDQLEEPEE
jgi:hypothetical protein